MEAKTFRSTDKYGNTVSGRLYVYLPGTTTEAPIFDADGAPLTQPVSTDENYGTATIKAANGRYDVALDRVGFGVEVLRDVAWFDGAEAQASFDALTVRAETAADEAEAAANDPNVITVAQNISTIANAADSEAEAKAARDTTRDYRDEAETHKNTAYGHAQDVASAVAYQNLAAIAETKAETAVDVFVYDTSKDSDGGAWRDRTQHTSWFNEQLGTATRGTRREFPAVAVIVAETDTVTIYDGDAADLPMWMVFNRTSNSLWRYEDHNATSIFAVNGVVVVGKYNAVNYGGVALVRFVADDIQGHSNDRGDKAQGVYKGPILTRNDGLGWDTATLGLLVDARVNDVAMTVLPGAPVDPATGLQVPTIAVATAGGVSVIKDDGTVVDSAATNAVSDISFDADELFYVLAGSSNPYQYVASVSAKSDGFSSDKYFNDWDAGNYPNFRNSTVNGLLLKDRLMSTAGANGLSLVTVGEQVTAGKHTGMSALLTSTYNTGWMPGDIKGCWLSDTETGDLVGSELVTNGTFDTDTSGWAAGSGATLAAAGGNLQITNPSGDGFTYARQAIPTVVGQSYVLTTDVAVTGGNGVSIKVGTSQDNYSYANPAPTTVTGERVLSFVATGTTAYVHLVNHWNGGTSEIATTSLRPAVPDRSVNGKGLAVHGTITRTAVETGADLVAYSGFSASNYLEQPYSADLDFTDTLSIEFWSKDLGNAQNICDRGVRGADHSYGIYIDGSDDLRFYYSTDGTTDQQIEIADGGLILASGWHHVAISIDGGSISMYIDGVLGATGSLSGNFFSQVTDQSPLLVGSGSINEWVSGELALIRISGTAPSADQIRKIYEDEKHLFQENAACTLYGASDAVTALTHDPDTGLLHVGTSGGRSGFRGLERVEFDADPVTTAISAAQGMVVSQ